MKPHEATDLWITLLQCVAEEYADYLAAGTSVVVARQRKADVKARAEADGIRLGPWSKAPGLERYRVRAEGYVSRARAMQSADLWGWGSK